MLNNKNLQAFALNDEDLSTVIGGAGTARSNNVTYQYSAGQIVTLPKNGPGYTIPEGLSLKGTVQECFPQRSQADNQFYPAYIILSEGLGRPLTLLESDLG